MGSTEGLVGRIPLYISTEDSCSVVLAKETHRPGQEPYGLYCMAHGEEENYSKGCLPWSNIQICV